MICEYALQLCVLNYVKNSSSRHNIFESSDTFAKILPLLRQDASLNNVALYGAVCSWVTH